MCQACIPQLSATTETLASQPENMAVAPRQLSLSAFVAIIFCVLIGVITVIGLLVWLVLWLQLTRMA